MSDYHENQPQEFIFSGRRTLFSIGLIGLILSGLIAYRTWLNQTAELPRIQIVGERTFVVSPEVLKIGNWAEQLAATGVVLPERQVDLRPLVAGQIIWVNPNLQDGGQVRNGETLLRIDSTTYEVNKQQADIRLATAQDSKDRQDRDLARQQSLLDLQKAQLALAEADLERQLDLLEQGLIAPATYEQAKSQTLSQRQTVSNTENALAQQRDQAVSLQNTLRDAELNATLAAQNVEDTKLVAPFDGIVVLSNIQEGQLVSSGDLAARIYDASALSIQFQLPQEDYARLNDQNLLLGQDIEVSWVGSQTPIKATLNRIGSQLNPEAGGISLFASLISSAAEKGLRPGSFVNLRLNGETIPNVFTIPREAYYSTLSFENAPNGGIYVVEPAEVHQGAEWQGPTTRAASEAINALLDDYEGPLENIGQINIPAALIVGIDESTTLGELYECKPKAERAASFGGWGAGRRSSGGRPQRRQEDGTRPTGNNANEDMLRSRQIGSQPGLRPREILVLCPKIQISTAKALPVSLVQYDGSHALITGSELDGLELIPTRIDRLTNGAWLTKNIAETN